MGSVSIRSLCKTYGAFKALDDVSLDIAEGEFLTLLGPSGSGKTTLLQTLAGFVRPTSGSILVAGEEILTKPPHRRAIGMVFQNYALFPNMDVAQNVAYPLRVRGVKGADLQRRVDEALAIVKLESLKNRSVQQLSGGQRQRVALARAIIFEPSILLMDEPLSALDKKLREQMQVELRRLHDKLGTTTILVTHDQQEALSISDRIAVINGGHLVQVGTPQEIYEHPRTKFVAGFIGETAFLPLEFDRYGKPTVLGQSLKLSKPIAGVNDAQTLILRPENLALVDAMADSETLNVFPGIVTQTTFLGDGFLVRVRLSNDIEVSVRHPVKAGSGMALPESGQRVHLGLHSQDAAVVMED